MKSVEKVGQLLALVLSLLELKQTEAQGRTDRKNLRKRKKVVHWWSLLSLPTQKELSSLEHSRVVFVSW
jgi:hypothetical protein